MKSKISMESVANEDQRLVDNHGLVGDHGLEESCLMRTRRSLSLLVFRCFFLISYTILLFYFILTVGSPFSRDDLANEGIYDNTPILHEFVNFKRAGFHDSKHEVLTRFEGKPNPQNNAAWDELLTVGIVDISSDENKRLRPSGTARSRVSPNKFIVEVELFHQLHCLKTLRRQLWEFEEKELTGKAKGAAQTRQRQQHFDHCIDYLRQVIMCHGDLTPNTFEWNEEFGGYLAHHSTHHKCRNFDAIFEWAAKRNTSGLVVDGDHMNVELDTPEMED